MTDRIHIRDLTLACIIGTRTEERQHKQNVVINIALECDLAPAGGSDKLDDTVNYKRLKDRIVGIVEDSKFFLIERLAEMIAQACLDDERVKKAFVTVDKPSALTLARSVAVEIQRP